MRKSRNEMVKAGRGMSAATGRSDDRMSSNQSARRRAQQGEFSSHSGGLHLGAKRPQILPDSGLCHGWGCSHDIVEIVQTI